MEEATSLGKGGVRGGTTENSPVIDYPSPPSCRPPALGFISILSPLDFLHPTKVRPRCRGEQGSPRHRLWHQDSAWWRRTHVLGLCIFISTSSSLGCFWEEKSTVFHYQPHLEGFCDSRSHCCTRRPRGGEAVCVLYGSGEVCLLDLEGLYKPPNSVSVKKEP